MSEAARERVDLALRELRLARGLSAEAAAIRAGVSKAAILGWESGRRVPSGPHLVRLLDALEASPRERARLLYAADPRHARIELAYAPLGVPVSLGELLRAMRVRRQTTQVELARKLGVAQSTIAKWESGDVDPDDATVHSLGFALGATTEETIALASVRGDGVWSESTTPEEAEQAYGKIKFGGPLTETVAMAYEAETWRRAVRDPRWDAALCRAISARAVHEYYTSAPGLGIAHAQRAIGLARSPEAKSVSLNALDIASEIAKRRRDDPAKIATLAGEWAEALPEGNARAWARWIQSLRLATLGRREEAERNLRLSLESMRLPYNEVQHRALARTQVYLALGDAHAAADAMDLPPDEFWHLKIHTEVRHALGDPVSDEWMADMRAYRAAHPDEFTWHDNEQWRSLERRQDRLSNTGP